MTTDLSKEALDALQEGLGNIGTPWCADANDAITALRAQISDLRQMLVGVSNDWDAVMRGRDEALAAHRSAEARATAAEAAFAAAMAGAVRVKPLEWTRTVLMRGYEQANSEVGQYQISWLGEFECWQLSRPHSRGKDWGSNFGRYDTKQAAKAEAQTDYESRIRAAIEPHPAAQDREVALIAALRGCIETADMVAADLQDKRSAAGSDMNAASLMANNRAARAILAAAEKEAGHD